MRPQGGRHVHDSPQTISKLPEFSKMVHVVRERLQELEFQAGSRGLGHVWRRIAEPWTNAVIPRLASAASFPSILVATVGSQEPNEGKSVDEGSGGRLSTAAADVQDSQKVHINDDTQEQPVLPTPAQSSTRGGG